MPRILGLLTKLKETVEADGAGEQKLYDEPATSAWGFVFVAVVETLFKKVL